MNCNRWEYDDNGWGRGFYRRFRRDHVTWDHCSEIGVDQASEQHNHSFFAATEAIRKKKDGVELFPVFDQSESFNSTSSKESRALPKFLQWFWQFTMDLVQEMLGGWHWWLHHSTSSCARRKEVRQCRGACCQQKRPPTKKDISKPRRQPGYFET